ncbi:hypothetical protein V1477_021343 [Vespula maculifrons]|uniref:Uncharacterized protein n=1 Tax=Vespula maculifrons TaxID=7453 RepID=A0ABD2AGW1_VESMC
MAHVQAADENAVCPETANIIKRNCYVDDLITGTHTFDEAIRIEDKVLDIASNDAFALQQWIFNEKNFISDFVNHSTDTYIRVDLEETTFILGRTILSRIEKLFNPHDLLGPIIAKKTIVIDYIKIQLHEFYDVSKKAYDACIYLRSLAADEKV